MSSAPLQLLIYAISDAERPAALKAITEADLRLGYGRRQPTSLELGELYGTDEASVGKSAELADTLRRDAPSAAFEIWQDPYATVGHYVAHVPGIGSYDSACDEDGTPLVDVLDMAQRLMALPSGTTVEAWLAAEGNGLLGRRVLDALDALRDMLPDGPPADADSADASRPAPAPRLHTQVGAFHLLDYGALEDYAREHYGRPYSAVVAQEGGNDSVYEVTASLTHTLVYGDGRLVEQPGLAPNDRQDLDLWLSGEGSDPHPGVILSDLAQKGLTPDGSYLVRVSW
ncbi:hypothetical protein ACFYZ8_33340 [Streptomyces sp. NPDC001668]|uniref:hypothetical protein n=1 Tax=Streptomyces sp. NPDC001668 TaxID=3364598 RepID=UPI0036741DE2